LTAIVVSPPLGLQVYQATRTTLTVMLTHAQAVQAAITANSILSSVVLNLLNDCVSIANFATQVESNAALEAAVLAFWAQDQETTTAAVGVSLNAMFVATTALAAAIQNDYPKDSGGFLQDRTFGASGVVNIATFQASQFPTTPAAITAWLATVQ
jgi:hypothetical protein